MSFFQRSRQPPRQVKYQIAQAIKEGCVVMIHKVKPRADGGKQLVSVGPYRTAVGRKWFALITKQQQHDYGSADSAARAFIDFVGRDRAWEALQHSCPRHRLRTQAPQGR